MRLEIRSSPEVLKVPWSLVLGGVAYFLVALLTVFADAGQGPPLRRALVIFGFDGWRVLLGLAVFWVSTVIFVRCAAGAQAFHTPSGRWGVLRLGLALHIGILLLDGVSQLSGGSPPLENPFYRVYVRAFALIFLLGVSLWVLGAGFPGGVSDEGGRLGRKSQIQVALALPLLCLAGYTLVSFALAREWVMLGLWGTWLVGCLLGSFRRGVREGAQIIRKWATWTISDRVFPVLLGTLTLGFNLYVIHGTTAGWTYFYGLGTYPARALSFLQGEKILSGDALGYYLTLALFYRIFGPSHVGPLVFQAILNTASVLLLYALVRRLTGAAVAKVTGVLFALSYTHAWVASQFHWAVLLAFCVITIFALATFGMDARREGWRVVSFVLAGALLAYLAAVRVENIIFALLFLVWFLWKKRLPGGRLRSQWVPVLALTLPCLLVLVQFAKVNVGHFGEAFPVTQKSTYDAYALAVRWEQAFGATLRGANPFLDPEEAWAIFKEEPWRAVGRFFTMGGTETNDPANNLWKRLAFGIPILFGSVRWSHFHPALLFQPWKFYFYLTNYLFFLTALGFWLMWKEGLRHPIFSALHAYLILRYLLQALIAIHPEGAERYAVGFLPFLFIYLGWMATRLLEISDRQGSPETGGSQGTRR